MYSVVLLYGIILFPFIYLWYLFKVGSMLAITVGVVYAIGLRVTGAGKRRSVFRPAPLRPAVVVTCTVVWRTATVPKCTPTGVF